MDAFWKKLDKKREELLAGDAAQSGRLEAAAQAATEATGAAVGACPSNTPPSSSQIPLPGFPEYKSTFGIDWLEYGGVTVWPSAAFEKVMGQLEAAKLRCQESEQDEVRILLNDTEPVYVQRIGMKRGKSGGVYFHYQLLYKGITICLARHSSGSGENANVFVALRGTDCLIHGALEAYATVNGLLSRLGAGPVQEEKISRVDLRLDVTGLPVGAFKDLIDSRHFISRVRMIRAWENKANGAYTGVTIGNRPRLLRIYDKIEEQRPKYDAEVHRALVDRCWGGSEPEYATRVEYQLGRTYLKRYGVHSVADLLSMLGSLLKQLTTEYFRFTCESVVSADKHQSRAEVHPLWVAIESAFLEHAQVPAQKLVPIRYELVQPRKLLAMAMGCLVGVMLQRKLVFATVADFVELVAQLIREHFRDDHLRQRFLKRYWQQFKDKPYDFPNAA